MRPAPRLRLAFDPTRKPYVADWEIDAGITFGVRSELPGQRHKLFRVCVWNDSPEAMEDVRVFVDGVDPQPADFTPSYSLAFMDGGRASANLPPDAREWVDVLEIDLDNDFGPRLMLLHASEKERRWHPATNCELRLRVQGGTARPGFGCYRLTFDGRDAVMTERPAEDTTQFHEAAQDPSPQTEACNQPNGQDGRTGSAYPPSPIAQLPIAGASGLRRAVAVALRPVGWVGHMTLLLAGGFLRWMYAERSWLFQGLGGTVVVGIVLWGINRDQPEGPAPTTWHSPSPSPSTPPAPTPLPLAPTPRSAKKDGNPEGARPTVIYDFLVEARLNCNTPEGGLAEESGAASLPEAPYLDGDAGYEELRLLQPVRVLRAGSIATLVNRFAMSESSPLRGSPTSFLLGFSRLHLPIAISPTTHWQCLSMNSYEITLMLNGREFWSKRQFIGKRPWQGGGGFDADLAPLHALIRKAKP